MLRGLAKVRGEWNLVCAAFNLRRPRAFAIACGWRTRAKPRRRRAGRNSAAGRRGRPRSAYEAPRAAVDRSTRFIGAESKRRGCPRLPAPPSRVMLLVSVRRGQLEQVQQVELVPLSGVAADEHVRRGEIGRAHV